jgi:putative phosphoesterase
MRLGILADTHDEIARTQRAIGMLRAAGADTIIHCGDLTGPEILAACGILPCYFTFGNHDADRVPELKKAAVETGAVRLDWGGVVELHGRRIGVTHGHMDIDVRRVSASRPDYLLFGHLHFPVDFRDGAVRRINPGALYRADECTVAILDLESDDLQFLTVSE